MINIYNKYRTMAAKKPLIVRGEHIINLIKERGVKDLFEESKKIIINIISTDSKLSPNEWN